MAMGAGSTAVGASCGAATLSRGVVSTTGASPSATMVVPSGATDSLATESPESTQSVETATVATSILVDQAEEGDEARHLTGGDCSFPPFLFFFALRWLFYVCDNVFEIESEISVSIDGYRRYIYHLERRDRREASVPKGGSEKASVRDKPHDSSGKGRFSPNYKL